LGYIQFRILGRNEIPDFADWGTFYRTIALNPTIYLHFLQSKCLSLGVTFRRATLDHIQDAFFLSPALPGGVILQTVTADVVVNCTGLLASRLGGVMDAAVTPVRGQLVIVENESRGMFSLSGDAAMDEEIGENCYIIDRPAGKCYSGARK
jgi:glycine/D-amino acid oxidase-like deaminating enzyme